MEFINKMRCPFQKKTCVPDQCILAVSGVDGEKICGIVVMGHNIMVIASRLDRIANSLEEKKDGK